VEDIWRLDDTDRGAHRVVFAQDAV
jgi:hypothetical protein